MYRIKFTDEQDRIIHEITASLQLFYGTSNYANDNLDEEESCWDESNTDENEDAWSEGISERISNEGNPIDSVAEKLFQFCINFLT
jgi:hypothetical protein